MNDTTGSDVPSHRIAPIRREITVGVPLDRAFALFTAHIGAWWPVAELSVHGEGSLVAFEGDRLVERSGADVAVWAEVVSWDPPREVRMAWHPGGGPDTATDLTVSFDADGDGDGETTVVTVTQSGWERMADPLGAVEEYGQGWPGVLASFQQCVQPSVSSDSEVDVAASEPDESGTASQAQWFALLHKPGPALKADESVFEHPMFGEHIQFLQRLADRGLLVAAGPLTDEAGSGMTVVKVVAGSDAVDVTELATRDDQCVAAGYLTVDVRPWAVQLSA
jgi:uncharacterized protein YciI